MRAAYGCFESEGRRGRLSNARARHSDKLDMVFGELEHQFRSGGIFPNAIMYLMENNPHICNVGCMLILYIYGRYTQRTNIRWL